MKILIAPCERLLRNGKKNPRDYPYWNELISLLSKNHDITILKEYKPLKELKEYIFKFDAIITIDSFIQHFCWYHGKQCHVIMGRTDPLIFGHKENINILLSRNNLRPLQFEIWEAIEYNEKVFPSAEYIVNNYFK